MSDTKKINIGQSLIQEGLGSPTMQVSPQLLQKGLQTPLMQALGSNQTKPAQPQNNGATTATPKKNGS